MWFKEYRDYPIDTPLIQKRVEPNHGIIGCEMHDLNGWGNEIHIPIKRQKKGLLLALLSYLLRGSENHG